MDSFMLIRQATTNDCSSIVQLIKELAEYEQMSERVSITEQDLLRDGFGENTLFQCKIAVDTGDQVIGYALYFPIYSTFCGKSLYLEDLYVTPQSRGSGIGSAMFRAVAQEALESCCMRLDFCVLSWNRNAVELYQKWGAVNITEEDRWNMFRMNKEAMRNFINQKN